MISGLLLWPYALGFLLVLILAGLLARGSDLIGHIWSPSFGRVFHRPVGLPSVAADYLAKALRQEFYGAVCMHADRRRRARWNRKRRFAARQDWHDYRDAAAARIWNELVVLSGGRLGQYSREEYRQDIARVLDAGW